jgi:thiol-disulfide isomerase/thioredoxin
MVTYAMELLDNRGGYKMSRLPLLALLLLGTLLALACSGGADVTPVTPDVNGQAGNIENHVAWGVFDIALNAEDGSAEIIWNRQAEVHLNVTGAVTPPSCGTCIQIVDSHYDMNALKFYLQVAFVNPTHLTGYDVRAVISSPGGDKILLNSDGVTSVWGAPMPFKAINVDPERTFGAFEAHGRMFEFYFPPGESFATMTYIIDANWPTYVDEPLVEEGYSPPVINNNFTPTYIRAKVFDHQGDLNVQMVMADMMLFGGSPQTMLYDDGMHNDGMAADGVFGSDSFTVPNSVPTSIYMVNVYAFDLAGFMGWGQVPVFVSDQGVGPNEPPEIQSIDTDRTTANGAKNEKVKITVVAFDPDDSNLGYEFEGPGTFTPGSKDGEVFWKPSSTSTGPQNITCIVMDTKGGEDSQELTLWSTNLSVVNGSTSGMIPNGTLESVVPDATLNMGSDFMDQVCYINVWATWCGYCVMEMPDLTSVYNQYKSNPDYNQIFLNLQETESQVQNFINSNNYACTYWALDPTGSYFGQLKGFNNGSGGIPQHFLFDRDGRCRWAHVGALLSGTGELEDAIDQLL